MKDIKLKRGVVDYVICGVAALFICVYASIAFQPVTSGESEPVELQEQQEKREPAAEPEPAEPELSDMIATFIDVGQGDSALVMLPDGKVMLIDAGEASASRAVLDALEAADVDDIDYLVATHPHADHVGGMEAVLDAYDVGEVSMPDAPDTTGDLRGLPRCRRRRGLPGRRGRGRC